MSGYPLHSLLRSVRSATSRPGAYQHGHTSASPRACLMAHPTRPRRRPNGGLMVIATFRGAWCFDESGGHAVEPDDSDWQDGDVGAYATSPSLNAGPWHLHDGQWRRAMWKTNADGAVVGTEWRYGPQIRVS